MRRAGMKKHEDVELPEEYEGLIGMKIAEGMGAARGVVTEEMVEGLVGEYKEGKALHVDRMMEWVDGVVGGLVGEKQGGHEEL